MPRLFERFHRVANVRARSNEGSGIGLALVKELVALHGGTIGAASREGEGTTFTVRLPYGNGHLPPDAAVGADGTPAPPSAPAEPYVQEALRWLPDPARCPPRCPGRAAARPRSAPSTWWSRTTTPTCGSTSPACCGAPATGSARSATARRRWRPCTPTPPTWWSPT